MSPLQSDPERFYSCHSQWWKHSRKHWIGIFTRGSSRNFHLHPASRRLSAGFSFSKGDIGTEGSFLSLRKSSMTFTFGKVGRQLKSCDFPSKLSLVSLDLSAPRKRNEHQGHGSFEVRHVWKLFHQMLIKDSSKWSYTEFSFHQSKSKVEEKLRGRFTLKMVSKGPRYASSNCSKLGSS